MKKTLLILPLLLLALISCSGGKADIIVVQSKSVDRAQLSGDAINISWTDTAVNWRGQNGQQYTVRLPQNGSTGTIWGTETYTDDSPIGVAAVHAGLISFQTGGVVTIEILAGRNSYRASTSHGISSLSYGSWSGSYRFVSD